MKLLTHEIRAALEANIPLVSAAIAGCANGSARR